MVIFTIQIAIMPSISQNIRYTQTRNRLEATYYSLFTTHGEDVYNDTAALVKALTESGFTCTIIKDMETAKTIKLPFFGILPEGDIDYCPHVQTEEDRQELIENYDPTFEDSTDHKIIAISY